ncbi:aspartic peptidase domain-containing protein [Halteromyces radiatus]|uniref:aspartic peptidase domain-containing protein n=1 Tax=Halteromyces radiatus TaxID=101107 RepID=UPI00221ECA2E|nr:aspartic peptidase domain-containing protein [Halteromyces radiatus]KAI8097383.1 aspartic peptidase domain-containing protein [Halteromyces radiatus]
MRLTSFISFVIAIIGLTQSLHADESSSSSSHQEPHERSFTMELKPRQVLGSSIPYRVHQVLEKYGVINDGIRYSIKEAANVGLDSILVDVEYVASIGIGTPPQYFDLVMDTGSADIWVPSYPCFSCGFHRMFDSRMSSTFTPVNKTWRLGYFDGSNVLGVVGKDTIKIGNVSHANQVFGLATSESAAFTKNLLMDGIFGLSFSSLSLIDRSTSLVLNMHAAGDIDEPVIGIYLGRPRDGGKGEVKFGGVNTRHYTGDFKYIPVTKQQYWQVDFGGIEIDGRMIGSMVKQAMLDTGTTLTVLPPELSQAIHAALPGARYSRLYGWLAPCNTSSKSVVTFKLGGQSFPVPIADLVRERMSPNNPFLCFSGVTESTSAGFAIIGESFLRSYYTSYDFMNARVGLAISKA